MFWKHKDDAHLQNAKIFCRSSKDNSNLVKYRWNISGRYLSPILESSYVKAWICVRAIRSYIMIVLGFAVPLTICPTGRSATLSHSMSRMERFSPAIIPPVVDGAFVRYPKCTIATVSELACIARRTDLSGSAGNAACRIGFIGWPGPVEAKLCVSNSVDWTLLSGLRCKRR